MNGFPIFEVIQISACGNKMLIQISTCQTQATSTNIASNLKGANIELSTTEGDINILGSNLKAKENLELKSANDVNIQAGYNGSFDESKTKSSSF